MSCALAIVLLAVAQDPPPPEQPPEPPPGGAVEVTVSSRELLEMASQALAARREDIATTILETLLQDPEGAIRNEARFRLAILAMQKQNWTSAGTYLRAILDEEPTAQRARLELARVQAELGDIEAARRTLRDAQAGELPPEVARLVERFSAALRDRKPFGANLQLSFAPDSNINRATRSDTLGTVLGEFELDDDARETSGIGIAARLETYYRLPLSEQVSLLGRVGLSGNFYRASQFNDMLAVASVGPEFPLARGRANLSAGVQRRWFGGRTYSDALTASLDWQRPAGRQAQIRTGLGYARTDNRFNALQDSDTVTGYLSYERAFSPGTGASVTVSGARQIAQDPAYSFVSAQLSTTGWKELGSTTVFASAAYQHFEADRRLALYPARRKEDSLRLSLGASNRKIQWQGFSPQVRVTYEKNWSPIEVYQFDRWSGEIGVVRAF